MTLPPGLQAIREHGVGWCNEKQFADVLDLTETLAGALEGIMTCPPSHACELYPNAHCVVCAARAALDKYREFGQPPQGEDEK